MTAQVHLGDCLGVVNLMPDRSCDLVYLDPPFFTQKRHRLATRARDKEFSFDDLWTSAGDYGRFLHERVKQFYRVLSKNGSIFFHCDRTASHIVRAVLDAVFGDEMFRAEIIWFYRRWSNARRGLLPQHQTILWYSKTADYTFNTLYERYSPSTNVDQLLQQRTRDKHGKAIYARDDEGDIVPSRSKQGVPVGDVWDIPYLNPKAGERVGYPTQKPILLLERVVKVSTNTGDTVLDPFCGSGTTLVAAALCDRNAIGIDVSTDAVALTKARLQAPRKTQSRLLSIGRESYEQADENAVALLQGLQIVPVHRNKGIDAIIPCESEQRNALVRVQREHEPLHIAVEALRCAAVGKHPSHLIIVATQPVPAGFTAPDGYLVIPAPGATIMALLDAGQSRLTGEASEHGPRSRAASAHGAQLSLPEPTSGGIR